ncbi:hypothetical protein FQA39_LY16573 [Lamprigera yunnana]|nr:hypothetical protein FQA39_LY16573 [Lamprigera yunnana]
MFFFVALLLLVLISVYYKWAFNYWKKCGVPYVEPSIPFGNVQALITSKLYVGEHLKNAYLLLKGLGHKHAGMYLLSWPRYLPIDTDIIKHILINDFHNFNDRGFYYNEKGDPLSANLFSLGGERWRILRTKLSPAFTGAKLKLMFDNLLHCGYQLQDAVEDMCVTGSELELKELSICYSINVIGLCAFGLDCNCFINPSSEFKTIGKKVFDYTSWYRRLKMSFAFAMPNLALAMGLEVFGDTYTKFFTNVVKETIEYRKKYNVTRKDLIQSLINFQNESNESDWSKHSLEELAAQVFIFFSAGFETTSTTLCLCLFELSLNNDVQENVRKEILSTLEKNGNEISFDVIAEMKYMTQVVEETLRKYPPTAFIGRKCIADYKIPNTDVILNKGMYVDISILGIHHDPEFYPKPEQFDPERFSEENKLKRTSCTYLPFGGGPRTCIGMRFAVMQIKVALTLLLKQYQFSVHHKTTIPVELEPYSFTLVPKSGIYVNAIKIIK